MVSRGVWRPDGCDGVGAVNLSGTGFASRDTEVHQITARIGGVTHHVRENVAGLAGFLLAKAAAFSRRKTKDWYDIAFVLLHHDAEERPVVRIPSSE